MKKILFALAFAGLGVVGFSVANAQYYDYGTSYDYGSYDYGTSMYDASYMMTGYTDTNYSSYSYPQSNYYYGGNYNYGGGYGSGYGYYGSGGIGSYTIGCTTYFYNTRTGAQLYTRYICTTYQQPTYYYPSYPTYPSTQYCTYKYISGAWYPSCGNSYYYGNYNYGYNSGYTNSGCYYQNGYQVCY